MIKKIFGSQLIRSHPLILEKKELISRNLKFKGRKRYKPFNTLNVSFK